MVGSRELAWVSGKRMLHVRLIESEGMGEGSSSGAQLALTDSELDPELEGNGAGKLSDINQRLGRPYLHFRTL